MGMDGSHCNPPRGDGGRLGDNPAGGLKRIESTRLVDTTLAPKRGCGKRVMHGSTGVERWGKGYEVMEGRLFTLKTRRIWITGELGRRHDVLCRFDW